MLTCGDEYPIHQTPEPVAFAGTDRNFYDRYFFNLYLPGSDVFCAVAFGIYPNLNIADAHIAVLTRGTQHCLHASRVLDMERMDLRVGPIAIDIVAPLRQLRVRADGEGLSADLLFTGRAFPMEEPRFTHRAGPRVLMDYTRLTQNGHWEGRIAIDGRHIAIPPGTPGTRDRSWGVRPVGAPDAQPIVPQAPRNFFWLWSPVNFPDASVFFHVNADAQGRPWNTRAVFCPDGAGPDGMQICDTPRMDVAWQDGQRHARAATLYAEFGGRPMRFTFTPRMKFQMRGIGYVGSSWPHGAYKGALAVAREDFAPADADPAAIPNLHIQALCDVTAEAEGAAPLHGAGVLEQLVLGPYAPYGFV